MVRLANLYSAGSLVEKRFPQFELSFRAYRWTLCIGPDSCATYISARSALELLRGSDERDSNNNRLP